MIATTRQRRLLIRLAIATGSVLAGSVMAMVVPDAQAQQVPPHVPGTICFTQWFWCPAQPPGPPGTQCACPSPEGLVPGIRG
jgi:hypothetical protein